VSDGTARLVRFGVCELDLRTGELRRKGVKVKLQTQPFEVLAVLLARHGDMVSREELRARLWPDAIFVDFDHSLAKAVEKIRRAIGDLARSPRYIETVARRGYRFVAPIEVVDPASTRRQPSDVPGACCLVWGERAIVLADTEVVIGRDPGVAIVVASPRVSRRHARIALASGDAILEDLHSKNGTFVNDRRLDHPVALTHGDAIRIGPARLVFHRPDPGISTETNSDLPTSVDAISGSPRSRSVRRAR